MALRSCRSFDYVDTFDWSLRPWSELPPSRTKSLAPLDDQLVLLDSGLDSLCFAILVARLESDLGVDPFTASEEITLPVTVGDFVELYERAVPDAAA